MKTAERAAIAKQVSDYIIDHLLEHPISKTELERVAREVTEKRLESSPDEINSIAAVAVNYFTTDSRVIFAGEHDGSVLTFARKQ